MSNAATATPDVPADQSAGRYPVHKSLYRALRVSRHLAGGTKFYPQTIKNWEMERDPFSNLTEGDWPKRAMFDWRTEAVAFVASLRSLRPAPAALRFKLASAFLAGEPIPEDDFVGDDLVTAKGFYLDLDDGEGPDEGNVHGWDPFTIALLHQQHREAARQILEECRPKQGPRADPLRLASEDYVTVLLRICLRAGYRMTVGGNADGAGSPLTKDILAALDRAKAVLIDRSDDLRIPRSDALAMAGLIGDWAVDSRDFKDRLRLINKSFGQLMG